MVVLESYFGGHMCGCAPQVKCKHLGKSAVFAAPEGFRNARRKMFKASTSPPQSNRENRTDQNMNRATKQNKTKQNKTKQNKTKQNKIRQNRPE